MSSQMSVVKKPLIVIIFTVFVVLIVLTYCNFYYYKDAEQVVEKVQELKKTFSAKTIVQPSKQKQSALQNMKKVEGAGLDEILARQKQGFLDGKLVRDLLPLTKYLNLPASPCDDVIPEMVALVQSACPHSENREAIRRSWKKTAARLGIPVVFFVGQCPSSKNEREKYGDLVEVDFVDNYYNNTLKSLSRLKWFLEFCPKSPFLFMSDDDNMVHLDYLLSFVRGGIGHSMIGHLYTKATVFHGKSSKWYVPHWAFPYGTYPDYLGGWCYVVNGSLVQELHHALVNSIYISIDDTLITGVAATMAGIQRWGDNRFPDSKSEKFHCGDDSIFCGQFFTPEELKSVFERKLKSC